MIGEETAMDHLRREIAIVEICLSRGTDKKKDKLMDVAARMNNFRLHV